MDDVDTDELHRLFRKFAKEWNRGKLAKDYYTGLPEEVLETVERTRHKWGWEAKLTGDEKARLQRVKDDVVSRTQVARPDEAAASGGGAKRP